MVDVVGLLPKADSQIGGPTCWPVKINLHNIIRIRITFRFKINILS